MKVQIALDLFSEPVRARLLQTHESDPDYNSFQDLAEYMKHSINIYLAMDVKRTGLQEWKDGNISGYGVELSISERIRMLDESGQYFTKAVFNSDEGDDDTSKLVKKGLTRNTQLCVEMLCKNFKKLVARFTTDDIYRFKPRAFGTNVVEGYFSTLRSKTRTFSTSTALEMATKASRVRSQRNARPADRGYHVKKSDRTNNYQRYWLH